MADVKDYPPYLDYPKERKKQTNADRIRQKTDEELAMVVVCPYKLCKEVTLNCDDCVLKWLKREVQDE